ncbi:PR domain zinc finger protein 5 isoform X2 [Anabrus simplex]
MNEAGPSRAYVTEGADKSTRAVNAVKKEVADVLYPKPDSSLPEATPRCSCAKGLKDPLCVYASPNLPEGTFYKCEVCAHCFASSSVLVEHILVHAGRTEFQCNICLENLPDLSELRAHVLGHPEPDKFSCPICLRDFVKRNTFDDHIMKHEVDLKCSVCSEVFPDKRSLNYHLRTRCAKDDFRCGICDKAYLNKGNLRQHMSVHTRVYKGVYKCHLCEERFIRPIMRHKHLLKHFAQQGIPL